WTLTILGENVYNIPETPIPAKVPGSVYGTLLEEELIPDPYYRDNELKALKLMENDFAYETKFELTEEQLCEDECLLRFDGIDTLGDIFLNGELLGSACNMHRSYDFSLKALGKVGINELKILLHSPTKYIKEENKKCYTGGSHECMEGFPHIRKAHCMYGWDWGPRLPDAGICREVSVVTIHRAELESVYVVQNHRPGLVTLTFNPDVKVFSSAESKDLFKLKVSLFTPDGRELVQKTDGSIVVENPELWFPRGYGRQPLYKVRAELYFGEELLDVWERRIGLRTMTVNRDKKASGENFAHEVNGVAVFAMGADYVPEDNIFGRITEERTRRLLSDAALANHNTVRVWGGGYYPDDYFYDICDELGLLVWQDFMFACASYELDEAFEENISEEIHQAVVRIRHHACLALWCGNNEMETQTLDGAWNPSIKQKYDYIKIFEYIIPKIVKADDPQSFYWPSSPSAGGNFDNPWNAGVGDTHYWAVWHGERPFTDFRKHMFSYVSEFGFQAFPSEKTIDSFALPSDKNIFSRIMEMHQRNCAANGKIMKYLGDTYLYPTDFGKLIYISQLLSAEGIRMGVEHFRRHRGECMGTVVWQLNDIWPVASWASIDYFGRWKALHYIEKRCFEPIHISCEDVGESMVRPYCIQEPGEIHFSARLHVANETGENVSGFVVYSFKNTAGQPVGETVCIPVTVPAFDGIWLDKLEISEDIIFDTYLDFEFVVDEKTVSRGTAIFTQPKHFEFADPELSVEEKDGKIYVTAKAYAKNVSIEGIDGDVLLSDNYFDMNPGTVELEILRGKAENFKLMSVYEKI
ncbi:MAG: glycosyl hydrolase 2 galactose-binding domain-containing protein, partial [Lachnospiraceae bacterium]